jgi:hypothetical protein
MPELSTINVPKNKAAPGRGKESHRPFFQPKLSINAPNDIYEQEADAMAEKVMRMKGNDSMQQPFFKPAISPIQRKCEHCEDEETGAKKNDEETAADSGWKLFSTLDQGGNLYQKRRKFL